MNELRIITNHHYRDLTSWYDIPERFRSDFDYVHEDDRHSTRFFRYRGNWYDLGEFLATRGTSKDGPLARWHGFQADSYFSGIVIRYSPDFERVKAGLYLC
jgi:hypothetical protein